jgi:type VI secretion system secreted protein VgrG
MNAKIDAAGSGHYAELDAQGRYKVTLPLDTSGRSGGKATTWLRMAQPYGGTDHGMHFPLHKGTEVLLTCIDGDPDRPIIQAAVPNPETPSLVSENNPTQCCITTGGQNRIHMEDMKGGERILMHSPKSNTWLRMGTPNDPPAAAWEHESEGGEAQSGVKLHTDAHIEVFAGSEATTLFGNEFKFVGGSSEQVIVGNDTKIFLIFKEDIVAGLETGLKMGGQLEFTPLHTVLHGESKEMKAQLTELTAEKNILAGEVEHLTGEVNRLEGEATNLTGALNLLQGDINEVNGSVNKLEGETSNLTGVLNCLQGDINEVNGAVNKLEGEASNLTGALNCLQGDINEVNGAVTRLNGEVNRIEGEVNNVSSTEINISALILMM